MSGDRFIVVRDPLPNSPVFIKYGGCLVNLVRYAAFRDGMFTYCGAPVHLRKGQCLVTARFLAVRWFISKTNAHRILKRFEKEGLIERKTITVAGTHDGTTRATLVTVVNYSAYQALRGQRERLCWTTRHTTRDIEEGSTKKERVAALVARDRENPAGPSGTGAPASEPPLRVAEIIEVHRSITGQDLRWTEQDVVDVTKLIDILGFPNARGRVELLAKRQMEKGNPPSRLGYYIKIIQEDSGRREPDTTDQRLRALTSGIGNGPVMSRPSHEASSPPLHQNQTSARPAQGIGSSRDACAVSEPPEAMLPKLEPGRD